jgi:hypothetical protein
MHVDYFDSHVLHAEYAAEVGVELQLYAQECVDRALSAPSRAHSLALSHEAHAVSFSLYRSTEREQRRTA